jgi:hypothetical protein
MPIWLRKFTYEKIKKHFEDKKEVEEKAKNQISTKPKPGQVSRPNIKPTYTTNAKASPK